MRYSLYQEVSLQRQHWIEKSGEGFSGQPSIYAVAPPRLGHRLTDEHVYLFTNLFSIDQRTLRKWADSTHTSVIKAGRIPVDPGSVFTIFNMPACLSTRAITSSRVITHVYSTGLFLESNNLTDARL